MSNRSKIVAAIIVIAVFCLLLAGWLILYPDIKDNAEISRFVGELYGEFAWVQMKTPYVSDVNKVEAIIEKLPVADGFIQRFSSVGDDYRIGSSSPNTLTIYYEPGLGWMNESDNAPSWLWMFGKMRSVSSINALMLFCLIEDLDEVCFAVRLLPTPGNELIRGDYTYVYTESREFLTKHMTEEIGYKKWSKASWGTALDNNYAGLKKYIKKENDYLQEFGLFEGYARARGRFSAPSWSYYNGYIGSKTMTLDDVRGLARKGSDLNLADLSQYRGISFDLNGNVHFEFEVEGGYFLAIYPGCWDILNTTFGYVGNVERGAWGYSSSDGIDIRHNDVNEFIMVVENELDQH